MTKAIHWHFNNPWRHDLTYVHLDDLLSILPDHYSEIAIKLFYGHRDGVFTKRSLKANTKLLVNAVIKNINVYFTWR